MLSENSDFVVVSHMDGGRYIGTGCACITTDPEEGWTNLGTYRIMVQNKNTLGFYISPGKHGMLHREKWFKQGKPCPVSISIGHDPLMFLVASKEFKYGESEYDIAGYFKGQPIDVIEGKNGIMIPARAEIVAEGYCYPGEEMEEGPFGEWTGYYSRPKQNTATIRVTRLMHRHNPIILGSPPSKPPNQVSLFNDILRSALVWDELEGAGIPGIQDICCHEAGGARFFIAISIKQKYPGHAKQVAAIAAQCHAAAYMGRYIVVVDDDIDVSNLEDVMWAVCTRSEPVSDIDIMRHCWTGPLDPIRDKDGYASRALIDACIPFAQRETFPIVAKISDCLAEQTIAKWGETLNS